MSESSPSKIATLAKLIASIVVAGGLVAALLLPFVGGTGVAVRNSADIVNSIPDELTVNVPQGGTKVLAADGTLLTTFYQHNRTPVASDQIADVMKRAQVDIEDSRFYEHNGVDVQGTLRALAKNVAAGGVEEGGSTITQQLVKQTLLQSASDAEGRLAATDDTVGRKLREARYALALEKKYTKDEILSRYLNMVYFGAGAYGIEAAAQTYFSVHAKDLNLAQASMLAGLVQSPKYDNPLTYPEAAQKRRNQVLTRMHQLGHISDQELADISAQPVQVVQGGSPPNGCTAATIGGFFCDYLHSYLTDPDGPIKLTQSQLENGGYTVQTTLQPGMQASGDQAVLQTVGLDSNLIGAYDLIEPGTGHVLAMSVNRRFGCSGNDECTSVNFGVIPTKGSGSTFKMFTAAAALESGLTADHTINAGSISYTSHVYKNNGSPYKTSNVGSTYPGVLTMTQALYMSSNTYFLALEDQLGSVKPEVEMAERLGMHFDYKPTQFPAKQIIAENRGSFTYGTDGVSPLDLASAYSTIAARGTKCDPTPVTAILDAAGKPAVNPDGKPFDTANHCSTSPVIDPGIADTLNQMMRNDVEPGHTKQTAEAAFIPGHQITGKTGTNNEQSSVTFVGSTPEFTAAVMVFNPLASRNLGGYGGGKPAGIWHDAMEPVLSARQTAAFPPEDPKYAGSGVNAPPVGASPSNDGGQSTGNTRDQADQPAPAAENGNGRQTNGGNANPTGAAADPNAGTPAPDPNAGTTPNNP